jgi:hypothetical protein
MEDKVVNISSWGKISIWNADNGQAILHANTHFSRLQGLLCSGGGDTIFNCNSSKIRRLKICRDEGLRSVETIDLNQLGLEFTNWFEDMNKQLYYGLVGVQLIEKVLVICYIVKNDRKDVNTIKLAFVPSERRRGKYKLLFNSSPNTGGGHVRPVKSKFLAL